MFYVDELYKETKALRREVKRLRHDTECDALDIRFLRDDNASLTAKLSVARERIKMLEKAHG